MTKINHAGTVPISTVDWTGRSVISIFLGGCPFKCSYCHNHGFIAFNNPTEISKIKKQIDESRPFISGVIFSGGEPLMQSGIIDLIRHARASGLAVGVHTNGCYPEKVRYLMQRSYVDKFFIDIKAPFNKPEKYSEIIGCDLEQTKEFISDIISSIKIASETELELRTTVVKSVLDTKSEINAISLWVKDYLYGRNVSYVIQQGIPERALLSRLRNIKPMTRDELVELAKVSKMYLKDVRIRTTEKGEEKIN
jgi:pyruvate formate lyase activating enzyme